MSIPKFDALLNKIKDNSITEDSSAPTAKGNGYFSVVNDFLWYFSGGNRYKIQATLDNPIGGLAGQPIGLLMGLTYS